MLLGRITEEDSKNMKYSLLNCVMCAGGFVSWIFVLCLKHTCYMLYYVLELYIQISKSIYHVYNRINTCVLHSHLVVLNWSQNRSLCHVSTLFSRGNEWETIPLFIDYVKSFFFMVVFFNFYWSIVDLQKSFLKTRKFHVDSSLNSTADF